MWKYKEYWNVKEKKEMGIFEGVLICTDLDGTLLRKDKSISRENIEAIEYFKAGGGLFTIITGRMPYYVTDICDQVMPNAPFGCVNGGGLYDFEKKEYVWKYAMADGVPEITKCIDEKFPDVGIQVCTFNKTFFCKENNTMKIFRKLTGLPNLVCHYTEVEGPIAKILFGSEENEEILNIEKTLKAHPLADRFDFIRSARSLFEILPKGMSKGTSIEKLSEILKIEKNKIVAIGDYDNDVAMFKAAGVSIAVSNACHKAKEAADYITVSNEENAIAQVIYDLERGRFL